MTAYKGMRKLPHSTEQIAAVGLGSKKIFQTYFVCIEHNTADLRFAPLRPKRDAKMQAVAHTEITYGKLAAG